mmetsp:Transcript_10901/g.16547  ORF Transcript_10901/g.16547 Transcript_10901/m.16547 type:complete len:84 (-) Transcript_10901:2467-2718(-)
MQDCINDELRHHSYSRKEQAECAFVIGIFGGSDAEESVYSFRVFQNIQHIFSEQTVSANVEQSEFQYFIYKVDCDDCSLAIGV